MHRQDHEYILSQIQLFLIDEVSLFARFYQFIVLKTHRSIF